jgi:hypothetical protein
VNDMFCFIGVDWGSSNICWVEDVVAWCFYPRHFSINGWVDLSIQEYLLKTKYNSIPSIVPREPSAFKYTTIINDYFKIFSRELFPAVLDSLWLIWCLKVAMHSGGRDTAPLDTTGTSGWQSRKGRAKWQFRLLPPCSLHLNVILLHQPPKTIISRYESETPVSALCRLPSWCSIVLFLSM